MSVPISLITFNAVKPSMPSIRVRSTPVIRYKCVLISKLGALTWLRRRPFPAGDPPSVMSSNRSNRASISRSHSSILA